MNLARLLPRLLIALLLVAGAGVLYVDLEAPLDPREEPGILTPLQLTLANLTTERCMAALERGSADFTPAPRPLEGGCGYPDGVSIAGSTASYGARLVMGCRAALAREMWERHVVQPAAREHLGSGVRSIAQFGTFACRNVNHSAGGRLSEHATAQAIDIAGFTTATGRRVSVLGDWDGGPEERAFLRAVRDGACDYFGTVLSPDYNDAHRDHFHFGTRGTFFCR